MSQLLQDPSRERFGDELDEVENGDTALTRNKALKLMSSAIFGGMTALLVRTQPAFAHHSFPPPSPCYGYPSCHYCDGGYCYSYCWWPHGGGGHCYTGTQYWEACYAGSRWRCRDWHESFPNVPEHHCVCRGRLGSC